MRALRSWIWLSPLLVVACARTRAPTPPSAPAPTATHTADNYELDGLMSVLWQRSSAEAEALYLQAWGGARRVLDAALADPRWTAAIEQGGDYGRLPPAIIVDIDETILDTSDYMVERLRSGKPFTRAGWNAYVQRASATPVPGALDFLQYAASKGVTVFYLSNREGAAPAQGLLDEIEPTRRNLANFGFPDTADTRSFLFRDPNRGWKEKGPRRAEVAKTHRILMLAGDNLYDFVDVPTPSREKRDAAVEKHKGWLGTRWIVLPNPMYGSWDSVIAGTSEGADARRLRLQAVGLTPESADTIANGGFER